MIGISMHRIETRLAVNNHFSKTPAKSALCVVIMGKRLYIAKSYSIRSTHDATAWSYTKKHITRQ